MGADATALAELLRGRHVYRPRLPRALPPPTWGPGELAGRLVELSAPPDGASAVLTVATALVLAAQAAGEPTAWIEPQGSAVYPPDLAESGVDLDALAVIRVPEAHRPARAAELLLRSGAFGLVVLDLGARGELSLPAQTRLVGLVQRHDATLLCLTVRDETGASLGSLISLHATATRHADEDNCGFALQVQVLKDKRRGPGWQHRTEGYRGPPGLR